MKKTFKFLLLFVLISFTTFWSLSILKCEYLTFTHGDEFKHIEEINSSAMMKVLEYDDNYARLYCINYNVHNGTTCRLRKANGCWYFDGWGWGVWSKHGTADGYIWPYGR